MKDYVNSLSHAISTTAPYKMRIVLYIWIITTACFLIWANLANIDEIVRAEGEIVPSGDNQIIQNLEGGIVEELLISEAQSVKKGDILIKIDNRKSESTLEASEIKTQELQGQIFRLKAEAAGLDKMYVDDDFKKTYPGLLKNEQTLFSINKQQLQTQIAIVNEQIKQTKLEMEEIKNRIKNLRRSLQLIDEEIALNAPMVEKGIKSKVDFLKLQREQSSIKEKYVSAKDSLPRTKSSLSELEMKKDEIKKKFMVQAQENLNKVHGELMRIKTQSSEFADQVSRTFVKSPVNGYVQKIFVHTIGGVVKPGDDLVEVVPSDADLWVDVKVKPSDIAFIYKTQKAIVKISAYDFSIYGALDGEVISISADTTVDRKENRFYTVKIKIESEKFANNKKAILMPGMTVNADIITGKKTVMDYILKPILKTKQYMFTER